MKWIMVAVISICNALADTLQSAGMRTHGEICDLRTGHFPRLIRNRYLLFAVAAMTVSFLAFLALLKVSDLSFAVPATATTYAIETLLAKYVLREQVGWRRWSGAVLVTSGVVLLLL